MSHRVIISEDMARKLMGHELLNESGVKDVVSSKEFKDAIIKAVKDDRDIKKVTEKQVKDIVAKCVSELFRGLWQRKSFWDDLIKHS